MNISKRQILMIFTAAAFVMLGLFSIRAFYYIPSGEVALAPELIQNEAQGEITAVPIRLEIPKIGVDASIQEVGITKSGNMATPNNFIDVGWYKYGTIPGNRGSAVIAGHVDNGVALPAVFGKLKDLAAGDEIIVLNDAGQRLRFIVAGSKEYDFDAKADEVFTENDGIFLKLITCSGVWIKEFRTHDKRLVVSAVLSE